MQRASFYVPALASLVLVGCSSLLNSGGSSDYGCPGMPQGVVCKTPATVYKMSNGDIAPTEFDTPLGANQKDQVQQRTTTPVSAVSPGSAVGGPPALMPLREPPKMMRIWFAPWIDKQDAWHSPSYQVVEVQSRRWATGRMEVQASQVVTPYLAQTTAAQAEPPKKAAPALPSPPKTTSVQMPTVSGTGIDLNAGLPVPGR